MSRNVSTRGEWKSTATNSMMISCIVFLNQYKVQSKVKVCFIYSACPVRWTAQSALRRVIFRHQLDFSRKHYSHAAITREE